MKKYLLSDLYFFNLKYVLKLIFDLFAFLLLTILIKQISSFEGILFYFLCGSVSLLVIFPDIIRSNKEGIFFLKSFTDFIIFFFLVVNPFLLSSFSDFKKGLIYFIFISISSDIILLIFHCLCYRYYPIAIFARKIKSKFDWID